MTERQSADYDALTHRIEDWQRRVHRLEESKDFERGWTAAMDQVLDLIERRRQRAIPPDKP